MSFECPICMDPINGEKNKVTTECGHCFHTNCLMTSIAHNGFGCPYCRTAMAEEPEEEESVYSDDDDDDFVEPYDDYALRGFRFLMCEERDEEDDIQEQYEQQLEEAADEHANDHELNMEPMPSAAYVAEKLTERGVTMEDLVKVALWQHDGYNMPESNNDAIERLDGEIYGKLRIIIGGFNPAL